MKGRFPLALAVVALLGCAPVSPLTEVGSGTSGSEDRSIGQFSRLRVTNAIAADVKLGSPTAIRVTADDNLLDNVRTEIVGSELVLRMAGSTTGRTPVRVTVTVPSLAAVRAESAGRVGIVGLAGSSLEVRAESAGRIELGGRIDDLHAEGTSMGQLVLGDLTAGRAQVRLDSGSTARLGAAEEVHGSVASGALLTLDAHARTVDVATESGGRVLAP
jgi:hypothetical protein